LPVIVGIYLNYQEGTKPPQSKGLNIMAQALSFEERVRQLSRDVERMNLPENRRAAQRRFQEGVDRLEEETYASKTLKLEIGALLRGDVRLVLARDTNLEVREVKSFLSSVFVLTARNAQQFRELERVQAWIRRIQESN
jgi:hypothetical protein